MASQVLSGASNPSYTNNTGQNVRVVINYMSSSLINGQQRIALNWAGISASANAPSYNKVNSTINYSEPFAIGRNLASITFYSQKVESPGLTASPATISSTISTNNAGGALPIGDANQGTDFSIVLPTELMIASGQTFSATCSEYNIVVIPEAG